MQLSTSSLRPAASKAAAIALTLLATVALAPAQNPKSIFPLLPPVVSTIPSNGDVNPYGVAYVPQIVRGTGVLKPGDVLVSNYNNAQNLQGTGTTILRIDKSGRTSTFYSSPFPRTGLTAALGVLSNGMVLIGNLPTLDGTAATVQPGKLSLLNHNGTFLTTLGSRAVVDGPWGMAIFDNGNGVYGLAKIFVSNILSGVISRFEIAYSPKGLTFSNMVLATGFSHRPDPAAIVLGPSGLAYDPSCDKLYVASSSDNAIYEIHDAASAKSPVTPQLFFQDLTHLHGPLDIAILPNGHLLVANSDGSNADPNQPSELVEYNREGEFLAQMPVDPNNGGAFGFAISPIAGDTFRLAAVDDNASNIHFWTATAQ